MMHYSRTTLRELKKRYLNVLKKCFLANLMAFGVITLSTPATAETITKPVNNGPGSSLTYEEAITASGLTASGSSGGVIANRGNISFNADADFISNTASYSGGAISNACGGNMSFNADADFISNTASSSYGGAISNDGGGTITFSSTATFSSNTASSVGGAIDNGGTIEFGSTATFENNTASEGGAIFNSYETIEFANTATFTENKATNGSGGAISNACGGNMSFNADADFTSNKATDGLGGAIYNGGYITFDNTAEFTSNTASEGGAIYNYETIEFTNTATFTSNEASVGGAIYNDDGTITFNGGAEFTQNEATGNGGGINNQRSGTLNITNGTTISQNSSGQNGGGLFNQGTVNVTNISAGSELLISNNTARQWGGGVLNGASAASLTVGLDSDPVTVRFVGNQAGAAGGALSNRLGAKAEFYGDVVFEENKVTNTTAGTSDNGGGAIYLTTNQSEYETARSEVKFKGNTTFTNNTTIVKDANDTVVSSSDGGAIYNKMSLVEFASGKKATFDGNSASSGGAIYNDSYAGSTAPAIINFSGTSEFKNNIALSGGGAIYNSGAMEFGNTATFTSNKASSNGGAIYNNGAMSFDSGVDFIFNTATNVGGAIANNIGGTMSFDSEVDFSSNESTNNGGAIYNRYGGVIAFENIATFNGNKSITGNGGAIYNEGGTLRDFLDGFNIDTYGVKIDEDARFEGNTASSGGAIYNTKFMNLMGTSTFINNHATTESGGAIWNSGKNSEARILGYGAFILDSESGLSLKGTFSGNTAKTNGGAVYNEGAMEIGIDRIETLFGGDTEAEGNHAEASGGAVYNAASGDMHIKNTTFENNTAGTNGGAIYNAGRMGLTSTSFINNTATNEGGAIYNTGDLTIEGGVSFTGNQVANSSANSKDIYMSSGSTLTFGSMWSAGSTDASEYIVDGGIAGSGTITKSSTGTLYLALDDFSKASDNTSFTGTFIQTSGTTIADSTKFFTGENIIEGGELITQGASLDYSAGVRRGGKITHTNTGSEKINVSDKYSFNMDADDAVITLNNGSYEIENMGASISNTNKLVFNDASVDFLDTNYQGITYTFNDTSLNLEGNVSFDNLAGTGSTLNFALGKTLTAGTSLTNTPVQLNVGTVGLNYSGVGYTYDVLNGNVVFDESSVPTDMKYLSTKELGYMTLVNNNQDIKFVSAGLGVTNRYEGEAVFSVQNAAAENNGKNIYTVTENDLKNGSLGVLGGGNKIVQGYAAYPEFDDPSNMPLFPVKPDIGGLGFVINANGYNLFDLQNNSGNLTVNDLAIQNASLVANIESGKTATFRDVNIQNSGETPISSVFEYTAFNNKGTLNLDRVNIDTTSGDIKNIGKISATASTLQDVINEGVLTSANTQMDSVINSDSFVSDGDTITSLTNTGEATLTDARITLVKNENAGAIDLVDSIVTTLENKGQTTVEDGEITALSNNAGTIRLEGITTVSGLTSANGGDINISGTVALEGGVKGVGNINNSGTLTFASGDNTNFKGTFTQIGGTTTADSTNFFGGTNIIEGGKLNTRGDSLDYTATVNGGSLEHTHTGTEASLPNKITMTAGSATFKNGAYALNNMGTGGAVTFENATVALNDATYTGVEYGFKNSLVDLRNSAISATTFDSLGLENANLAFDAELKMVDGSLTMVVDTLQRTNGSGLVNLDLNRVNIINNAAVGDSGLVTSLTKQVLLGNNLTFKTPAENNAFVSTDVYQYEVSLNQDAKSIDLTAIRSADGNSLKAVNQYDGDSAFYINASEKWYDMAKQTGNIGLGETGSGKKTIQGAVDGEVKSVIDANEQSMFNVNNAGTDLLIKDLEIQGATSVLTMSKGRAELNNVVISNTKNKEGDAIISNASNNLTLNNVFIEDEKGLIQNDINGQLFVNNSKLQDITNKNYVELSSSSVDEVTNKVAFTSQNSKINKMINNSSFTSDGDEIVALENNGYWGEVTNGEIGTLINTGKAILTDTKITNTLTVDGGTATLTGRSKTVSVGGDTTVAIGAKLEATNATFQSVANSGVLASTNTQMGSVTNSDSFVSDGDTIADLTNTGVATLTDADITNTLTVSDGTVALIGDEKTATVGGNTTVATGAKLEATNATLQSVANSGVLASTNTQMGSVTNSDSFVSDGDTIADLTNTGEATLTDATITLVKNENAGAIDLVDSTVTTLENKGQTTVSNGDITALTNNDGAIRLEGMTTVSGLTSANGGDINISGTVALEGGVKGVGNINNSGTLTFASGDNKNFKGTFTQTDGTTTADSTNFFGGTNIIKGGKLNTSGDSLDYTAVATGGVITHDALGNATVNNANNISINNTGKASEVTFKNGTYTLAKDMGETGVKADTVKFDNATVQLSKGDYLGETYSFNGGNIDMQDGEYSTVQVENIAGSGTKLSIDIGLISNAQDDSFNGLTAKSDLFAVTGNNTYTFSAENANFKVVPTGFNKEDANKDNGILTSYTTQVLSGNAVFDTDYESAFNAVTNAYTYGTSIVENKTSGKLQDVQIDAVGITNGESLAHINQYDGNSNFYMTLENDGVYEMTKELGNTNVGQKLVQGASLNAADSTIDAGGFSMFNVANEATKLTVENLSIKNATSVLNISDGEAFFDNVVIKDMANPDKTNVIVNEATGSNALEYGLTLNNVRIEDEKASVYNKENGKLLVSNGSMLQGVKNEGVLVSQSSGLQELENEASFISENDTINSLINKAEATLKNDTVTTLDNTGVLISQNSVLTNVTNRSEFTSTDDKVETLTNTLNASVSGGVIKTLNNQGNASLTNTKVEMATNDNQLTVSGGEIVDFDNNSMAELKEGTIVTTLNNKGVLTSLNTVLGDVTNSSEFTSTKDKIETLTNALNATVSDGVIKTLKNTGTATLNQTMADTVVNEGVIDADKVVFDSVENKNKIVATNDLEIKNALSGTGTLAMNNAKLTVQDSFKTSNNLVSNNMIFSENIKDIEVADLTVQKQSTLDIRNIDVKAKDVVLKEDTSLKIGLNGLDDFGTLSGTNLVAKSGSQIDFELGKDFEMGLYNVVKMDNIESLPTAVHNDSHTFLDMADGRYSFISKEASEVSKHFGSDKNQTGAIMALHENLGTTNADFAKLQTELIEHLQSGNSAAVKRAVDSLDRLGGNFNPVITTIATDHFEGITGAIADNTRLTSKVKGLSGGDDVPNSSVWVKGLYNHVKNENDDGFKVQGTGFVLGVQRKVNDDLTMGIGYAYGHADVEQTGRDTVADTNTAFAFAKYQPSVWFVEGVVGYSRSQYEEDKQILSTAASATYNVDTFTAQAMLGYDLAFDFGVVTPKVGARYMDITQEAYIDSLGTHVDNNTSRYMTMLAGIDFAAPTRTIGGLKIIPQASVLFGYDVGADDVKGVNTLDNKAVYVVEGDALSPLSTALRLGVDAQLSDLTELSLEYTGAFRQSHQEHGGMMRLKQNF